MDAAGLLRLISEPTRHAILATLRSGEQTVNQIVTATQGEQSNISHHLRTLREAGLVRAHRTGRHQHYRLAETELGRLLDQVDAVAERLERITFYTGLELPYDAAFHGYG